ncbi:MAG: ABC transporter ATP-binding protein [Nitrospirae bacterium]|nr:ABC transporter ATP-binding protein [Nitrospirota bacterium]
MKNAIEIRNLKKVFQQHISLIDYFSGPKKVANALNGISFDIKEGEIFGLLGPNGAGKTTLIKILTTLIIPTEGTAKVHGYDIIKDEWQVRNIIGLIHSDERSFFWRLTGRQNLEFFAAIFHIPGRLARIRIDEVIAHVGLERHADNLFFNYSTGMKQRLAIARGLLNSPRILFMDEAMRSIDPISTQKIREFIKTMIRERNNMTIIMATNRLDEATNLCDRVAILNKGHLVKCGSIGELEAVARGPVEYEIEARNLREEVLEQIRQIKCVHDCKKTFNMNGNVGITITLDNEEESIHMVLQQIISSHGYIVRCDRREPSFDETFNRIITEFEASQERGGI